MLTIYGRNNCNYCIKAKDLAEQYSLNYTYKSLEDWENVEEMLSKAPNTKTAPQIWWNGKHIGGYKEFAVEVQNTIGNYGQGAF
tara:strand:- start:356 stop:607 length:252 start_codon:yes stop_codon:yes gene_type:complete